MEKGTGGPELRTGGNPEREKPYRTASEVDEALMKKDETCVCHLEKPRTAKRKAGERDSPFVAWEVEMPVCGTWR